MRSASLGLCLLVLGCGTVVASPAPSASTAQPSLPATPSPTASRPIDPGTQCGASAAFSSPPSAPPSPQAFGGGNLPAWSARPTAIALSSVAISPDGQLLAIAGAAKSGNTAQLWTASGSKVAALGDGSVPITCLAWSPEGSILAGASGAGGVTLWDRNGQFVRLLSGADPIYSLAWSPDGKVLATGAIHFPGPSATGAEPLPGIVQLWSRGGSLNGTLGTQFTGGKFLDLAWSPDGSMLAAGAGDFKVWRADGTEVGVPRSNGAPAWAMVWSPDSSALALGDESGILQIVQPDGTTMAQSSFDSDINGISYSPDGGSLAVGHGSLVSVVKAIDGRTALWSEPAVAPASIWSVNGKELLISTADGLALASAGGPPSSTLAGCPGNISAFSWVGSSIVAATDAGWLCSWSSGRP